MQVQPKRMELEGVAASERRACYPNLAFCVFDPFRLCAFLLCFSRPAGGSSFSGMAILGVVTRALIWFSTFQCPAYNLDVILGLRTVLDVTLG